MAALAVEPAVRQISKLPEAPVLKVSEIAPRAQPSARPPVPPLPGPAPADPSVVIKPDADGVIDESAIGVVEEESPINPFRVRYHPPLPMRDLHLGINSILIGTDRDTNAVVINGKLYSAGDDLCGLRVSAISNESIDLRHGNLLLRLPVQDKPVTLRLPKSTGADEP